MVPTITSICLHSVWSVNNVKNWYMHHEVSCDQLCGCDVTGIKHVTSGIYVSLKKDGQILWRHDLRLRQSGSSPRREYYLLAITIIC